MFIAEHAEDSINSAPGEGVVVDQHKEASSSEEGITEPVISLLRHEKIDCLMARVHRSIFPYEY